MSSGVRPRAYGQVTGIIERYGVGKPQRAPNKIGGYDETLEEVIFSLSPMLPMDMGYREPREEWCTAMSNLL